VRPWAGRNRRLQAGIDIHQPQGRLRAVRHDVVRHPDIGNLPPVRPDLRILDPLQTENIAPFEDVGGACFRRGKSGAGGHEQHYEAADETAHEDLSLKKGHRSPQRTGAKRCPIALGTLGTRLTRSSER